MIKASAADKLQLNRPNEDLVLAEVKSNGERTIFKDHDVSIPTALYLNARIFVSSKDHIDALVSESFFTLPFCRLCSFSLLFVCAFFSIDESEGKRRRRRKNKHQQSKWPNWINVIFFSLFFLGYARILQTPLPEQEEITEGIPMELEHLGTKELAFHITQFDWDLFWSVHEYELLYHTFGRHHFGKVNPQRNTFILGCGVCWCVWMLLLRPLLLLLSLLLFASLSLLLLF